MSSPTRRTLTGTFENADDSFPVGERLTFTLLTSLTDAAGDVVVTTETITKSLDDTGSFSVDLVADSGAVAPQPVYVVRELFGSKQWYRIVIPAGDGPVDLSTLRPVGTSPTPPSAYALLSVMEAADAAVLAAAEAYTDTHTGGGTGAVASVNGHVGVVVLGASDVGADPAGAAAAAQAAATAVAATDATSKASAAQAAAISAAATDATTKANAAQTAATSAAATDATAKVATETARATGVEALKADLVAGKVPTSQLPAIPTFTTHSVASQGAMLALTPAAVGDVAIRTDATNARYLLTALPASTLGNWLLLDSDPLAGVDTVNGQSGTVVLAAADVGADTSGAAATAQVAAATDATTKANAAQAAAIAASAQRASNLSDLANAATARTNLGLGTAATQASTAFDAAGAAAAAQAASQPLDLDLTALAALDSTQVGTIGSTGAGWILRSWAQVKTALGLTKADVGLGNVDNVADASKPVSTAQAAADAAVVASSAQRASNLSDLASASTARTNLGLGTAATHPVGDFAQTASNLSDLANASTARTNLGLGSVATHAASEFLTPLTPTATKTAAYTAAVGDLAMMNVVGGGTPLTLPTAPADKSIVGYRAIGATTAVPLVINAGGSDTIGTAGATTASIPLADEVAFLQYQASATRWLAISNVKTQTSLDGRYLLLSTVTTKGDLLAATAASTVARVGVGSDGQVLTADSASTAGVKWATAGSGATVPRFHTGRYYFCSWPASIFGGQVMTASTLNVMPFTVGKAATFDRIGCHVTAAAASSAVRLGIYADDGSSFPGALVLDAGTVDTSATTGIKTITISQTLAPGLYWLGACAQGGAPSIYRFGNTSGSGTARELGSPNGDASSLYGAGSFTQTGVTGALPGTFVYSAENGFQQYAIFLRAA